MVLSTKPAAHQAPRDRVAEILRAVSARYRIAVPTIVGPERHAATVRARHVAIYLTRRLTRLSLVAIGRRFGDRGHAAVIHAVQKIERRIGRGEISAKDAAILAELGVQTLPSPSPRSAASPQADRSSEPKQISNGT